MPPSKKKQTIALAEVQAQKSPAEFFAEHQQIAGYDNPGKSLYTTIRELVENSLDAAESIGQLPVIQVSIVEYSEEQFNETQSQYRSGKMKYAWQDLDELAQAPLKTSSNAESSASKKKAGKKRKSMAADDIDEDEPPSSSAKEAASSADATTKKKKPSRTAEGYFCLTVKDNGCGMTHAAIPQLLGRVLSGSKHGVRQTRGKFGLGAKMALIWAKKSTGVPVRIQTAHRLEASQTASSVSQCILDIDIAKNQPKVLYHKQNKNTNNSASGDAAQQQFQGTELQVWIAGNWTTYRGRISQYFQQLAIITPYAVLELKYDNLAEPHRAYHLRYDRRSEQMPPLAQTVNHHPASVNNLVLQALRDLTRTKTLVKFLSSELAGVSVAVAKKVIAELQEESHNAMGTKKGKKKKSKNDDDDDVDDDENWAREDTDPHSLTDGQITRLVQVLRGITYFKAPDGSALSPLGEYNLNLGIRKVLEPDLVATARDKPGAYEGHSFIVEAAVSLGGAAHKHTTAMKEEGITVCRFANRIPLLFEGGADVVTRVALGKIKWSQYKMDPKRDKIGVFVSIVSTKIPFKGTSKEYIGDDATAIQLSVKRALQTCCQQLRVHLTKQQAFKDAQQRKSRLTKYIPDVGRSLFGILKGMEERHNAPPREDDVHDLPRNSPAKRLRLNQSEATSMIERLQKKKVTEATIVQALRDAIHDNTAETEQKLKAEQAAKIPLYLVPLYNLDSARDDVVHSNGLFTFRPLAPIPRVVSPASTSTGKRTTKE